METHDDSVKKRTSDGDPIIVGVPSMGPIFSSNGTYHQRCNKSIIQNMGNTKVTLFRGWTLNPGGTLVLGLSYDFGKSMADIPVEFDNTSLDPLDPNPIKRVEIIEFNTNHPDLAFHSGFGKTK